MLNLNIRIVIKYPVYNKLEMSIEALFPRHNQKYEHFLEKIIVLISKPKSTFEKNEWDISEIRWTISDIKNSYLITNKFLHQQYIQMGSINNKFRIRNIQYKNIEISKLLPGKYELRLYIKFINTNNNQQLEKYNLSSFTILDLKTHEIGMNSCYETDTCFSNKCIILDKNK